MRSLSTSPKVEPTLLARPSWETYETRLPKELKARMGNRNILGSIDRRKEIDEKDRPGFIWGCLYLATRCDRL